MTEAIFFFPAGVAEVLRLGGVKVLEIPGTMVIRTRLFVRATLGDGVETPLTITRGVSLRAGMRSHCFRTVFLHVRGRGLPIAPASCVGVFAVASAAPDPMRDRPESFPLLLP